MADSNADKAPETETAANKNQAWPLMILAAIKGIPSRILHGTGKAPLTEAQRHKRQARVLKTVAIIKGVMFVAEAILSFIAHSSSLRADALDSVTDMAGTGASAAVHKHSQRRQALVALAKAGVMAAGAFFVIGVAALTLANPVALPAITLMFIAGGAACIGNLTCAALLLPHRNDNINMNSSWKSIRLDAASNGGVLLAAGIGLFAKSAIPDPVIGILLSGWCLFSAAQIAREAISLLRMPENAKKKKPGKTAPPHKAQPGIIFGLKRILHVGFNRRAATGKETPAASKPEAKAAETLRYEDQPKPDRRGGTGAAGAGAAAPAPAA